MSIPYIVHSPQRGYLLEGGSYGGVYHLDLRIFTSQEEAGGVAAQLTRPGLHHTVVQYRSAVADADRNYETARRARTKSIKNSPFVAVPYERVFVPHNEPSPELLQTASENYMLDFALPVTVTHLLMKGTIIMGMVYEQRGEVGVLEDYEYDDFTEVYREESWVKAQRSRLKRRGK